jgi:hypothetical protein
MLYTALWYFPVIITVAGLVTLVWDSGVLRHAARHVLARMPGRRGVDVDKDVDLAQTPETREDTNHEVGESGDEERSDQQPDMEPRVVPAERELTVSWKLGTIVIVSFFVTFIAIMVARAIVPARPLLFGLFSNMYLAGTIIFGGGPVVIPLLRQ